jgi:hypothetical protein
MGGFMLYKGKTPIGVLTAEHMERLLSEGRIVFPDIDEDEIKDRSKGDGLSKFLVIVQTWWFIAQCITRKAEGLVITELELVTLAFAVLNAAMYFFWWSKPLNVAIAVRVPLLEPPAKEYTAAIETVFNQHPSNVDENTASKEVADKKPPNAAMGVPISLHESQAKDDTVVIGTVANELPFNAIDENPASKEVIDETGSHAGKYSTSLSLVKSIFRVINLPAIDPRPRNGDETDTESFTWPWDHDMIRGILGALLSPFRAICRRVGDMAECDDVPEGHIRVPTFFASPIDDSQSAKSMMMMSIIGAIFGGIHLFGWNFVFPSHTETILWRISSTIITGVPAVAFITSSMRMLLRPSEPDFIETFSLIGAVLSLRVLRLGIPVYILARLSLLTDAFLTLRNLQPGAYALPEWTSFLPHV